MRGVVHRGWYPELGHPNPDEHVVRREVRELKALGFNLVRFAGWVPPHRYLDALEDEGMRGWIELPRGGTGSDPERAEAIFAEVERVVLQYRRHACLAIWTLGVGVPDELRATMTETVRALTGAAWVADAAPGPGEPIGTFDLRSPRGPRPPRSTRSSTPSTPDRATAAPSSSTGSPEPPSTATSRGSATSFPSGRARCPS